MKNKHILIVFLFASIAVVGGAFLKIKHIGNAEIVLILAMFLQLAVVVYLVVKNILNKKKDKFWDN